MAAAVLPVLCLLVARLESGAGRGSVRRPLQSVHGSSGPLAEPWDGRTVQDLHREYSNIFRNGNRNAASHLWSSFLINRAPFMPRKRFIKLSGGYCAVSGSPVDPSDVTRYKLRLDHVDGSGKRAGFMYYCCWPCVCDTQDFIRVDTKTIRTADGSHEYMVAVIGNPCDRPAALTKPFVQPFDGRSTTIHQAAPEVQCDRNGKLIGATMSDNDYVIISLFFEDSKRSGFQDEADFEFMCEDRKQHGYNSGMGEIFRRVAAVSPVKLGARGALLPPAKMNVRQLRAEILRRGLDARGATERHELVALLEESQAAELRKLSVQKLRFEASRLGLETRGLTEKNELVALLEQALVAASGQREGERSQAPQKPLTEMSVRELRAEVARLGLNARGCLERIDFVNLLQEERRAHAESHAEVLEVGRDEEAAGRAEQSISEAGSTCNETL